MTDHEHETMFTTTERVAMLIGRAGVNNDVSDGIKRVVVADTIDRMMSGRERDNVALVNDTISATRDAMGVQIAGMILVAEGKVKNVEVVDETGPDPKTFDVATLRAVLDYIAVIPSETIFAAIHELTQQPADV